MNLEDKASYERPNPTKKKDIPFPIRGDLNNILRCPMVHQPPGPPSHLLPSILAQLQRKIAIQFHLKIPQLGSFFRIEAVVAVVGHCKGAALSKEVWCLCCSNGLGGSALGIMGLGGVGSCVLR